MPTRVSLICAVCGQSFDVYPYLATRAKWCSRACRSAGLRAARPEAPCLRCGRLYARQPCKQGRYCSRACAANQRPLAERFWEKVTKGDACWEWSGFRDGAGYGALHVTGRPLRAPRVSWELHFGPIPDDLWVCHHCDNPPCVRPDHLFLGTASVNVQDMVAKGRNATGAFTGMNAGATHGMAKLNEDDVRAIRLRAKCGERLKNIARDFRVHRSTIGLIVNRKAWTHI
jgi:hypothetical protein